MTKMIKLSLAAAVAVSALTTTATAGSLEDAIKDTTISGKALVGYNYTDDNLNNTTTNSNEYDFDLTLTTKVNDTISFTTGIQADHDVDTTDESTDQTKASDITLTKLYFTAKTDVATVMVGKQKQPTPFLDDERGDGVVAVVPAGPVTIAAGTFSGMTAPVQTNINALAVIGSAGPVNASAWLLDVPNTVDGYSVNLSGKAGPVNVALTHSSLEMDKEFTGVATDNSTLTKLVVSGAVSGVNLVAGYGMTNDNTSATGRSLGVDLTSDHDAKTNFAGETIELDAHNDAQALLVAASMTFGATTVGATYIVADVDNNTAADIDADELDLTVKYAMSKNFSITGLYSAYEAKQSGAKLADTDTVELSLNYKF